jgi:hypothetical protein
MSGSTTCPGCGLELPASGLTPDPRGNASPECWQLYGEVQGFELHHIELVRDYHRLTVDAYAAQHASRAVGGDVPPISVAYALVGLHLALDRRVSGLEVRAAHQRMGKPDASWPGQRPLHHALPVAQAPPAAGQARTASPCPLTTATPFAKPGTRRAARRGRAPDPHGLSES